jgi:S-DNA-T family DNA segregation ATPase FtsK/SpoIIIE
VFAKKRSKKIGKKIINNQVPKILANRIFREATWFVLLFLGLYITLALGSYSPIDPSWSNAVNNINIHNMGGILGAYLSDLTLYAFGISAWWLVFLSIYSIFLIYPRIENADYHTKHILAVHYFGFFVLILSSAALEAGHVINISAQFPAGQGGFLGHLIHVGLYSTIGYIGSLIFLVIAFAIGFSLFTGWSWITISEGIGNFLFNLINYTHNRYLDWQDRREGKKI